MNSAVLIPVEEYLSTTYEPECDYVDGQLEERNVGEREHSRTQMLLSFLLQSMARESHISVWPEMRLRISATRFRVPDICVYRGSGPADRIFRTPPFLCVEILSPEDRMSRMQAKLDDYLNFGVEFVWVIDPVRRTASVCTSKGLQPVHDGVLRTANPDVAVRLDEVLP